MFLPLSVLLIPDPLLAHCRKDQKQRVEGEGNCGSKRFSWACRGMKPGHCFLTLGGCRMGALSVDLGKGIN